MPISDEVIELAPVKKTKTTLIVMIIGMVVLLGAAVAFLVMYLLKPSVTEDKNHVKDVSVVATELFSDIDESGNPVLYASIGNEYIVYSTITVDNNSSTNVSWTYDGGLLDIIEEQPDSSAEGGAYIKFVPKIGTHGKVATITARAAVKTSEFQKIEVHIVNQGAEDLRVTQYGVSGNLQKVENDTTGAAYEVTIPYYTAANTTNNKTYRINFTQYGKYNASTKAHSKLTSVDLGGGKRSNDVTVALKNASDKDYIVIDSYDYSGFSFHATKQTDANKFVEVIITANVNNDDFDNITKTIKIKVVANTAEGYIDSILVFNKPVVDQAFMAKVVPTSGNTQAVSTEGLDKVLEADKTLQVKCSNDKFYASSKNFELILPFGGSITYDSIFSHVLLNPVSIQYSGGKIKDDWYGDLEVISSDSSIVTVAPRTFALTPKLLSGTKDGAYNCVLTIADKKTGGAGVRVDLPVRVVLQTSDVVLSYGTNSTSANKSEIQVPAVTGGSYDVKVTYNLTGPQDKESFILEQRCINVAYKLDYNKDELSVKIKGDKDELAPGAHSASFDATTLKQEAKQGNNSKYSATLTFTVTVKRNSDGNAVFHFIKDISNLYIAGGKNDLASKDKGADVSAAFEITKNAESAKFISEEKGRQLATKNGTAAGNFVRVSDNQARLYIQNETPGDISILSSIAALEKFVDTDGLRFTVVNKDNATYKDAVRVSNPVYVDWSPNQGTLRFKNNARPNSEDIAVVIEFDVFNVDKTKIATLKIELHLVDAITEINPTEYEPKPGSSYLVRSVTYGSDLKDAFIQFKDPEVNVKRVLDVEENVLDYDDINIFFEGQRFKTLAEDKNAVAVKTKSEDGTYYTFSYNKQDLYKFEINSKRLTALSDIFAVSYKEGHNFGSLELEFLPKTTDFTAAKFVSHRMPVDFVRNADGVVLFNQADCEQGQEIEVKENGDYEFIRNQDVPLYIYASSVIKFGDTTVYVNRKSDNKSDITPTDKAWFTLPSDGKFTIDSADGPNVDKGEYYYITGRTPTISGNKPEELKPSAAHFSGGHVEIRFTITNAVRTVKSIGFYGVKTQNGECSDPISDIVFGKFINGEQYEKLIYIKIEYIDYIQNTHTEYESVDLRLPSYLTIKGLTPKENTNTYIIQINDKIDNAEGVFVLDYTIELVPGADITGSNVIKAVRSKAPHSDDISYKCTTEVSAGLAGITVEYGNQKVELVAGNTDKFININFSLKNPQDLTDKEITLKITYTAINGENYTLVYDYASAKLVLNVPTVTGLSIDSNDRLSFVIAATGEAAVKQNIVIKFTDTFNNPDSETCSNVFTLNLNVNVTMDIYKLAFTSDETATVTVTGETAADPKSQTKQSKVIGIVYNDGVSGVAPSPSVINEATVLSVCEKVGDKYQDVSADQMYITKSDENVYTLYVYDNIVWKDRYFYLKLSYLNDGVQDIYKQIIINTLTAHLEFDRASSNVKLSSNNTQADIIVKNNTDTFTVKSKVVNDGSGAVENKAITYKLYTNDSYAVEVDSNYITIDASGVIKFVDPQEVSGTLYYRALYLETNNNEQYSVDITINYTIAPVSVTLSDIDTNLFSDTTQTLTLYFGDASSYLYADLTGKIVVATDFKNAVYTIGDAVQIALDIATFGAYINVTDQYKLIPLAVKDNIKVAITASYGGGSASYNLMVNIQPIATLSLESNNGSLNLLDNTDSLNVKPQIQKYDFFKDVYGITDYDGSVLAVSGGTDDVRSATVTLSGTTAAQKGGTYDIAAKLTYTFKPAGGGVKVEGKFESTATYTVTVTGEHIPAFDLYVGGDKKIEAETTHFIESGDSYKIVITNMPDVAVTYSATATPNVVNIGSFSGGEATVTLNDNASGQFVITVVATIGGSQYNNTKSYTLLYKNSVTGALYLSENGGYSSTEFTDKTLPIDYSDNAKTLKYAIANLPEGAIVDFKVSGINADDWQKGEDNKHIIITLKAPAVLRVSATVVIDGRNIYLEEKTVELTATAPEFVLNADNDSILPLATAQLSVTNNAQKAASFKGDFSDIEYAIDSSEFATIDSTSGLLTVTKDEIYTDKLVIVTATVKVKTGVFAGKVYTLVKAITIKGVPLPTISWADGADNDITGSKNFGSLYNYNNADSNNITEITMSVTGGTLSSSYYSISGYWLNIDGSCTQGGTVKLKITAKITSKIHKDVEISDTITVRVLPKINEDAIVIGNAKHTYDLNDKNFKSLFKPEGFAEDNYSVTNLSLSGDNYNNFSTAGALLYVNNDLTSDIGTVQVMATVTVTSGTFVGATIDVTKQITVTLQTGKTVNLPNDWDSKYSKQLEIGDIISVSDGTVAVIEIKDESDLTQKLIAVNNNGSNKIALDFSKYAVRFDDTTTIENVSVTYEVTLDNGRVYRNTVTYVVAPKKVTVSATIGENPVNNGEVTINSGENAYIALTNDGGFDLIATSANVQGSTTDEANYLTAKTFSSNEVLLAAGDVTSTIDNLVVTISLTVAGKSTTFTLNVSIQAAQTGLYNADNNNDKTYAKNAQSAQFMSSWAKSGDNTNYDYATKVTITASNTLSTYLSSISMQLGSNGAKTASLNQKSAEILFGNNSNSRTNISEGFTLTFRFKTTSTFDFITLTVSLTVYNSQYGSMGSSSSVVSVQYRVRVINPITVTLNTNADGDTVSCPDSINVTYDNYYTGLPNLTRTGYNFVGWFTMAEGGTLVENDKTLVTDNRAHTLYAHWEIKYFKVVLEARGGNINGTETMTVYVQYKNSFSMHSVIVPTREETDKYYRFDGWFDGETSGTKQADSLVITEDITLYAHWTQVYKVTFNLGYTDESAAAIEPQYYAYNDKYALPKPTRDGYSFDGWYDRNTDGNLVQDGNSYSRRSDLSLYARWTKIEFTVNIDMNDAEGAGSSHTLTFKVKTADELTALLDTLKGSRAGYSFVKWATTKDGDAWSVPEKLTEDINLVAHWTKAEFTITIDMNDAEESGSSRKLTFKVKTVEELTALLDTLKGSRAGYTFDKWTASNGGSDWSIPSKLTEDISIVANWTKNPDTTDDTSSTDKNNPEESEEGELTDQENN